MSPDLKTLALRAIAAGAPEADDHTVIVTPGVSFRSIATGLVYDRATRLPLLSDPSWLGWVLEEMERRGYRCSFRMLGSDGWYHIECYKFGHHTWIEKSHNGRPAAIVAMLEATR